MQHLNPPTRLPVDFPESIQLKESLENSLEHVMAKRAKVLAEIETLHARMTERIRKKVAEYERSLYADDLMVLVQMNALDDLRAQNTPLRLEVWALQARLKDLK